MNLPEIRVTRKGVRVDRVEWDPSVEGAPTVDLTGMRIIKVDSTILPHEIPTVCVTFIARIVEVQK